MRCMLNVPHDKDLCDGHFINLCDKLEFGAIRFFKHDNHEYVVFIPLCRIPILNRTESAVLRLATNAMELEINSKILTKNEVRELIQEFDEDIDINKTQFSEYHDRTRSVEVKPVYSVGLGNCPYQLFSRRDVINWIHNILLLRSVEKWGNKERKPINQDECEICNRFVPSHVLEIVQGRIMIDRHKDTWFVCPRCKKEVLPQEIEERKWFDISEANSILKQLTPKNREILECHHQEKMAQADIKRARSQFSSLKRHLKENNLEALKSLAEELKPPPTSPI